jgi:hypothetical protein
MCEKNKQLPCEPIADQDSKEQNMVGMLGSFEMTNTC